MIKFRTQDAAETRALGVALASLLRRGDLIMLSGPLGAGKTTFTQGIGTGLGVRGRVASPTFIVAREHPHPSGGIPLIHADAYRITDLDDLETLDLEAALPESVTVVEWGEGKTEGLSADRLEIQILRPTGDLAAQVEDADLSAGGREIICRPASARWSETELLGLAAQAGLAAPAEAIATEKEA